jgi:DNA helicase-2/ATP-dependent DNA helicase PcrA
MVPQRFYVHQQAASGDRHVYGSRTRFIAPKLAALFESRAWPQATGTDAAAAQQARATAIDIAARMREKWR